MFLYYFFRKVAVGILNLFFTDLIDLAARPTTIKLLSVKSHQRGKLCRFNPDIFLYLSEFQQGRHITGYDLKKELKDKKVLSANVLDYLLKHAKRIPSEWKDKKIYFWGTIYQNSCHDTYVRYLFWTGARWSSGRELLSNEFASSDFAAIAA